MRNIVLITFDSLRADHTGYWGYERDTTPNLDEMAENGIVYRRGIAPASRTNPSMAGIFTGEPMVFREQVSNPTISESHLSRHGTIVEELSSMGYQTGAFNPNAYASRYYGFDRGFDFYEDFLFSTDNYQTLFDKHLSESGIYDTLRNLRNLVRREEVFRTWETYVDEAIKWAANQDGPFFLWMFSLDTHFPYLTPRNYRKWSNLFDQYYYNWQCNRLIAQYDVKLSDKTKQKMMDIYDDSIRYADLLLRELRERLAEFDPIFVVHGDHGEAFAEHGMYGHFYPTLREENVHTPLIVFEEDGRALKVDHPVSLCDIPEIIANCTECGTQGYDPTGRFPVIASDYDGRRDRNLIGAWLNQHKAIFEETGSERTIESFTVADGEGRNAVNEQESETLRLLVEQRFQHEQEVHRIRNAVERLNLP